MILDAEGTEFLAQEAVLAGAFGVDDGLVDGEGEAELLTARGEGVEGLHDGVPCGVAAANVIVLIAQPIDGDEELEGHGAITRLAEIDDALAEEAVGGDVEEEGAEAGADELGDLGKVLANEGFAAGEANGVHGWEFTKDAFDLVDPKVVG
jgi:hypothetical protein